MSTLLKTLTFVCFVVFIVLAFGQLIHLSLAATAAATPSAHPILSLQLIRAANIGRITQLIVLQSGLMAAIRDIQFNPDGTRLAILNADGFVDIWDMATLRNLFRINTGTKFENVRALTFNADGSRLLVTGGKDKMARQYAANGDIVPFLVFDGSITAEQIEGENTIIFSPDSKSYVFGGPDGAIIESNIQTGHMMPPFGVRGLAVLSLAYSPDGKILASVHPDNGIRLWDAKSHKQITTLRGHTVPISAIAFSADSKLLASAGADRTVRLWNTQTGRSVAILKGDPKHDLGKVLGLAFNADGTVLASGGTDRQITLWNVNKGSAALILKSDQSELGDQNEINAVTFSPDGTMLAVAGADGTVRLWGVRWPATTAQPKPNSFTNGLDSSPAGNFS